MKTITMKDETAIKIAKDLFYYFQLTMYLRPPKITKSVLCPTEEQTYRQFCITINNDGTYHGNNILYTRSKEELEEFVSSYSTIIHDKNRKFEVQLFESPDELGFNSKFYYVKSESEEDSNFDNLETLHDCLLCEIVEERQDGKLKYNMVFSFNLVTMEFIELFQLDFFNATGILREADVDKIENELQGISLALKSK